MRQLKDSGVEWIGRIPNDWQIIPHKYLMSRIKELCLEYDNENVLSLTKQGVVIRDLVNPSGKMPTSFDGYQRVFPNNLLLCLFDIDVTPRCVGLIKDLGVTSPAYSQFALMKDALPEYYNYLLLMMDDNKAMLHLSKNLRSSLTETDFGTIKSVKPTLSEQIRIVKYLDLKINMIENIIDKTKQSIDEYKKLKQSIITEAVTKGLNPDVKMKDSGIEWIGDIPEHYKISRPNRVSKIIRGNSTFQKEDLRNEGDYVALQYGKTYKVDEINDEFQFYVVESFYKENQVVETGDTILVSTSETIEDLGHSCFYNRVQYGLLGGEQFCLKPNEKIINGKFLYYTTCCFKYELNQYATGLKVYRYNADNLKKISIIIPPLDEQLDITLYLDRKLPLINNMIKNKQTLVTELDLFKKSFIYEVITGKKEVK